MQRSACAHTKYPNNFNITMTMTMTMKFIHGLQWKQKSQADNMLLYNSYIIIIHFIQGYTNNIDPGVIKGWDTKYKYTILTPINVIQHDISQ